MAGPVCNLLPARPCGRSVSRAALSEAGPRRPLVSPDAHRQTHCFPFATWFLRLGRPAQHLPPSRPGPSEVQVIPGAAGLVTTEAVLGKFLSVCSGSRTGEAAGTSPPGAALRRADTPGPAAGPSVPGAAPLRTV